MCVAKPGSMTSHCEYTKQLCRSLLRHHVAYRSKSEDDADDETCPICHAKDKCQKADDLLRHIQQLQEKQQRMSDILTERDVVLWMQSSGVDANLNELVKAFAQTLAALHIVRGDMEMACADVRDPDDTEEVDAKAIGEEIAKCITASDALMNVIQTASNDLRTMKMWSRLSAGWGLATRIAKATKSLLSFAYRHKIKIVLGYMAVAFMFEAAPLTLISQIIGGGTTSLSGVALQLGPCLLQPLCNTLTPVTIVPLAIVIGMHMLLGQPESVRDRLTKAMDKCKINNINEVDLKLVTLKRQELDTMGTAMAALQSSSALPFLTLFMQTGYGFVGILGAFGALGCWGAAWTQCHLAKGVSAMADAPLGGLAGAALGGAATAAAFSKIGLGSLPLSCRRRSRRCQG